MGEKKILHFRQEGNGMKYKMNCSLSKFLDQILAKFLDLEKYICNPNAKSLCDFDYYTNPFKWRYLLYHTYVISLTGNHFTWNDLLYHTCLINLTGFICFDLPLLWIYTPYIFVYIPHYLNFYKECLLSFLPLTVVNIQESININH